jgi:predicted dehydrogenase
MRIAIIGCGFVADYYLRTLPNYPELEVAGVMDQEPERADRFSAFYELPVYRTLEELLADHSVEIVLNLTNPRSHFEVSKACLEAGKHVYSEKPLAMVFEEAEELVRLAEQQGLYITSAPCNILGETAQTIWQALRLTDIGKVRLVYAELDEGLVHRMRYAHWLSESGTPWPYKDEFEVGCTMEHAGYYVTWLTAFFGPAKKVTSFASCLIPDKQTEVPLDVVSPDFSVACIEFLSGVVARLTCSGVAPHDHRLHIIGDEGELVTEECWNYGAPVYIRRRNKLSSLAERFRLLSPLRKFANRHRRYPLVRKANYRHRYECEAHQMDFARGVAELAAAITEQRRCRMSANYALHVNEIVLTMQSPQQMGSPRTLISSFEPMAPMPWAQL